MKPQVSDLPQLGRVRAAELLDCSPQLIDKLIRKGTLRAFRVGKKVLLREDDLRRMLEEAEVR